MTAANTDSAEFNSILAGNEKAFAALFRRHYGSLMVYAMRFLPPVEAQDVVSESFIKLWSQRMMFDAEAQAYKWMQTTVRNAAIDILRQQQRQSDKLQELLQQTDEQINNDQYQAALEVSILQKIAAAIKALPERQQQILKMFFFDGLDNAAIASKLDISIQAVKNQKVTGLKSLRAVFGKEDLLIYIFIIAGQHATIH